MSLCYVTGLPLTYCPCYACQESDQLRLRERQAAEAIRDAQRQLAEHTCPCPRCCRERGDKPQ